MKSTSKLGAPVIVSGIVFTLSRAYRNVCEGRAMKVTADGPLPIKVEDVVVEPGMSTGLAKAFPYHHPPYEEFYYGVLPSLQPDSNVLKLVDLLGTGCV